MPRHERGRLLTVAQLNDFFGVTRGQLKGWEQTHSLKHYSFRGERAYYENQVKELLKGGEQNDGVSTDALRALQQHLSGDERGRH